jgi:2-C-methyl-D-erythritol 4-phosphate cytidylyltransferase
MAELGGRPMLAHTLGAFAAARSIGHIVLVCPAERTDEYRAAIDGVDDEARITFAPGGTTRQDSVASGLRHVPDGYEIVAVHDGARPLVTADTINEAVSRLADDNEVDGVVVGHPAFDTLKIVDGARVLESPDRSRYWVAQTPQVFRLEVLLEAHSVASDAATPGTDDASLVERIRGAVVMLEGPRDNIKVTVEEDIAVADAVIRFRRGEGA